MKAVLVRGYGDVNQFSYGDTPDLKPGPGEVLVRMAATSINPDRLETPTRRIESVHAIAVPGNPRS